MEPYGLISYAISMGPNGFDVWLSGGISKSLSEITVLDKINVIRSDILDMNGN